MTNPKRQRPFTNMTQDSAPFNLIILKGSVKIFLGENLLSEI